MTKKPIPKQEITRRLKIIEGHLKKVTQMVEEDKYCIDILQQSAAVQSALKKVDQLLLDKHLHCCVTNAMQADKTEREKSIQELLEIFNKSKK